MKTDVKDNPKERLKGLRDLVQTCMSEPPRGDEHHSATDPLFPLLVKETSLASFQSSPSYLIKPSIWDNIPAESSLKGLGERMLQFDALANYFQDKHYKHLKGVCICTAGFLCFFEVFAHWQEKQPLVLLFALGLLGVAYGIVAWLKSRTYQMAYLSTRTVAEILRIQFFLEAAGVDLAVHVKVPRRYKPILGRILIILDRIREELKTRSKAKLEPDTIKQEWFEGQKTYFKQVAAPRERKAARTWILVSSITFFLGLASVAGLAVVSFLDKIEEPVGKALLVVGPSLLGIAAISEFYLERRGFKHSSERYLHSVDIYEAPASNASWDDLVLDVGLEALHEVVGWYVASVEREICVPKG